MNTHTQKLSLSQILLPTTGALLALTLLIGLAPRDNDSHPPKTINVKTVPHAAGKVGGASGGVDFHKDVKPILKARCSRCHSGNKRKGGFSIDTRQSFIDGGESAPGITLNKPASKSHIFQLITSKDPDERMPSKGKPLTPQQINTIKTWIESGLDWPKDFSFTQWNTNPVLPRKVTLPNSKEHPIDQLLNAYYKSQNISQKHSEISDATFARRAYLDLIGLLPTPNQLNTFVNNPRKGKRENLIDHLLSQNQAYAQHWLTFWNDVLRNAYRGTGYIDGGRRQITAWLYTALYRNKPYNQFVHQLISPVKGSEGFINGIKWRGVVNASQRREMQAAQNVAQIFMGTNLKCASCHDSFINHWKLADAHALASVFADKPIEIHRCDKPTGKTSKVAFIYPELGSINAAASKPQRMKQLADIITQPKNARLARTIVNRLWAHFFGQGIIEPIDDMDQKPFSPDLLDYLANDFILNKYNLKHLMKLILTSRAYQSPTLGAPKPDDATQKFQGPIVKRMNAETFLDAVSQLTNDWPTRSAAKLPNITSTPKPNSPNKPTINLNAQWIWSHPNAAKADPGGSVYLRKTFHLQSLPENALAVVSCDNEAIIYINGKRIAHAKAWNAPTPINLKPHLKKGFNLIAVHAINYPDKSTRKGLNFSGSNPAGLIFFAAATTKNKINWTLKSDNTWMASPKPHKNWRHPSFKSVGWKHASTLANVNAGPWRIASKLSSTLANALQNPSSNTPSSIGVRTVLLNDAPLSRVLGRPNREQVVTRRESITTTLQAIALTNGSELDRKLKAGAQHWTQTTQSKSQLLNAIYLAALSRKPNPAERAAASSLLTTDTNGKIKTESIEDLLWAVIMLPEFQLIY